MNLHEGSIVAIIVELVHVLHNNDKLRARFSLCICLYAYMSKFAQ